MAISCTGVTPLINMLIEILSSEYRANDNAMTYADAFSAVRNLQDLRRSWSVLIETGSKLGYYPQQTKTWLVVKPCASEKVESVYFKTYAS